MTGQSDSTKLALLVQEVQFLRTDVTDIKQSVNEGYVTKAEYNALDARLKRVEQAVYGFISLVLVLVLTAVVGSKIT